MAERTNKSSWVGAGAPKIVGRYVHWRRIGAEMKVPRRAQGGAVRKRIVACIALLALALMVAAVMALDRAPPAVPLRVGMTGEEVDAARSVGWKHTFVDELLPKGDAVVEVDFKDRDRRTAYGGSPDQDRPLPPKMRPPLVAARVERFDDLVCSGVDPGDVRPLMVVARKASQTEDAAAGAA